MDKIPENTRRHRRFPVDLLEIRGSAVFSSDVVIQDISVTGISLFTDRKLETGREYGLRILDKDLDFTISGTTIWSGELKSEEHSGYDHLKYTAGLQFNNPDHQTVKDLVMFVLHHLADKHKQGIVHDMSGSRSSIRFRIGRKDTAVLDVEETYRVRKLSLGGMLIESAHSLDPETRFHMGIDIPPSTHLSLTGRVVTCAAVPHDSSGFEVGIEFIDMAEQHRAVLKDFIRKMYLEDAGFSL